MVVVDEVDGAGSLLVVVVPFVPFVMGWLEVLLVLASDGRDIVSEVTGWRLARMLVGLDLMVLR